MPSAANLHWPQSASGPRSKRCGWCCSPVDPPPPPWRRRLSLRNPVRPFPMGTSLAPSNRSLHDGGTIRVDSVHDPGVKAAGRAGDWGAGKVPDCPWPHGAHTSVTEIIKAEVRWEQRPISQTTQSGTITHLAWVVGTRGASQRSAIPLEDTHYGSDCKIVSARMA